MGAFEHFYSNNHFGTPGFGTHYVVLTHEVRLAEPANVILDAQHSAIRWLDEAEIRSSDGCASLH
jgi:hypothetical protein